MTAPDYTSLLDDEVRTFISNTRSFYPDRGQPPTLAERRADFEAVFAGFAAPHPEGLNTYDTKIANGQRPIAVRWYLPTGSVAKIADITPVVIYFHGGGFVLGGLESHDSIVADLAHGTGLTVMAVDYALAPEHRFPAACEDALKSVQSCLNKAQFDRYSCWGQCRRLARRLCCTTPIAAERTAVAGPAYGLSSSRRRYNERQLCYS